MSDDKPYLLRTDRIGSLLGLTFPQDLMDRYEIEEGTHVYAVETPDGILIKKADASRAEVMEAYERITAQYGNALRELAKA